MVYWRILSTAQAVLRRTAGASPVMKWKGHNHDVIRGTITAFIWKDGGRPRNPLGTVVLVPCQSFEPSTLK